MRFHSNLDLRISIRMKFPIASKGSRGKRHNLKLGGGGVTPHGVFNESAAPDRCVRNTEPHFQILEYRI